MGYGNAYSNKPFELASKTSHTNIINNQKVQSFLSRCKIPPYQKSIEKNDFNIHVLGQVGKNPIRNIVTIDGGYTNIPVKEEFPSSTIAIFQFGALIFKYQDLIGLKNKPFIDPEDISKFEKIQRLEAVIPTKSVIYGDEYDFISSVRRAIYDFFMDSLDNRELIETLKWLIFEEYNNPHRNIVWHLARCPHCKEVRGVDSGVDIRETDISNDYTIICPHCQKEFYLTDVLRLHEAMDNELGASGILGYLTVAVEHIIIAYIIKNLLWTKPTILSETLFVKDGPLAFFGQTANLHKPMRKLMSFLHSRYNIFLVGLEKSGSFVEHAEQIAGILSKKQFLLLGNQYIYKYIIPGQASADEPYGVSSYYGHKVIFKSEFGDVYVASIPSLDAHSEPQVNDYINLNEILYNITALRCDLYHNSLLPIALVNKLVSLASHPSSDLIKAFAKDNIST